MASSEEAASRPLIEKAIDMGIDPTISNILNGLDMTSSLELIEQLSTDIDKKDLELCRSILFENAKLRFQSEYQTTNAGKPDPKLELSGRNGDLINQKYSRDIIDLCKYVFEKVDFFPQNVLTTSCKKTYLDLVNSKEPPIFSQENAVKEPISDPKDALIASLTEKYDRLASSVDKFWKYLLNVETLHGDELMNMRNLINELKAASQSKQSTSQQLPLGSKHAITKPPDSPTILEQLMTQNSGTVDNTQITSSLMINSSHVPDTASTPPPGQQCATSDGAQQRAASGAEHDGPLTKPTGEGHHAGPQHQDKKKPEEISNTEDDPITIHDSPTMNRDNENSNTDEDNQWITPRYHRDNRNRKRNHSGEDLDLRGGSRPKYELIGMKQVRSVEMYVHGLHLKENQSFKDLATNVRRYCEDKGVRVMTSRIIRNWHDDQLVGCKISVPERNMDTVIADRFWPHFVTCRKWEVRKRNNQDDRDEQNFEDQDDREYRYTRDRDYRGRK